MKLKFALLVMIIPFPSLYKHCLASDVIVPEVGLASWYGTKHHGEQTASGEAFDMHGFTAAHKTLPIGTKVRVVNLRNGKHVIVRINDRGPFNKRRIIDLSSAAAKAIGLFRVGVAKVRLEVVQCP